MAEQSLINKVDIVGNYGDDAVPITFSSNDVTTTIVSGLTVTKSADKSYWADGPLVYTITVKNDSGAKFAGGSMTDVLNTTLVSFDTATGVTINGAKTENFTYNDGTLTVILPDMENEATTTVVFQVNLVS